MRELNGSPVAGMRLAALCLMAGFAEATWWTAVGGPCSTSGGCVRSPNYPLPYGNNEACTISVPSSNTAAIYVHDFKTEQLFDRLKIDGAVGAMYHGRTGPYGVVPTSSVTWSTDVSSVQTGWELCEWPPTLSGTCSDSSCDACTSYNECIHCSDGSYVTEDSSGNGVCQACSSDCGTCSSIDDCTSCSDGSASYFGSCNSGTDTNPWGGSNGCYDSSCLSCTSSSYGDCTSCAYGYYRTPYGSCTLCDRGCSACTDYLACTSCDYGYTLDDGVCNHDYYHDCHWGDDDWSDWYGRMIVGVAVGAILAIAMVVLGSVPVCCGVCKETNLCAFKLPVTIIAVICNFIPLFAAWGSSDAAINHHCDECGRCTEQDREDAKALLGFFASIIAYFHGFGFVVVILATVAEVLACCMCCPCCGPLKTYKEQNTVTPIVGATGAPQGQVVGMPVESNVVDVGSKGAAAS